MNSTNRNLAISAGAATAVAIGGVAASMIANREAMGVIYNHAYLEALSVRLPNLVFNLGVAFGADKANEICESISSKLTHKTVELLEEKAIDLFVDSVAEVIAQQLVMGTDLVKAGFDEVVKKPLNGLAEKGREKRTSFVWHWTKKISLPFQCAAAPLINAAGEVHARELERNGTLEELTNLIQSSFLPKEDCDYSRSMNPLKAGIFGAVSNTFYNAAAGISSLAGTAHGKLDAHFSDGTELFEEAVNNALARRTDNRVDLQAIARRLGLKDLTSEPFRSQFTDSMEFTAKIYQVVKQKVHDGQTLCYEVGMQVFNRLNDQEFNNDLHDNRILY